MRFIWEGDCLTPTERDSSDKLASVEGTLGELEDTLEQIVVDMKIATMNSADGGEGRSSSWIKSPYGPDIQKALAVASHRLDAAAALLDSVVAGSNSETKLTRRELALRATKMMAKCDGLVVDFKKAKATEECSRERFLASQRIKSLASERRLPVQ